VRFDIEHIFASRVCEGHACQLWPFMWMLMATPMTFAVGDSFG
jgi:hypothetical protein